jgi:hypothetical protein
MIIPEGYIIILVPILYLLFISSFWEYNNRRSVIRAENNSRKGIIILWIFSGFIIVTIIVLSITYWNDFSQQIGVTNIILAIILSLIVIIAGIGVWIKRRWGIILHILLMPIIITCLLLIVGMEVQEIIMSLFLFAASLAFIFDLRSLWSYWKK